MLRSQDDSPAFRKLAMERSPLFIPRPLGAHTFAGRGFMAHGVVSGGNRGASTAGGVAAAFAGSSASALLARQEQLISAGLIPEAEVDPVRSWGEGARRVGRKGNKCSYKSDVYKLEQRGCCSQELGSIVF